MRMDEIRTLAADSLQEELEKAYKELFNLRFQKATRQLADTSAIRKIRKDVARLQTVLRGRQLAEQR